MIRAENIEKAIEAANNRWTITEESKTKYLVLFNPPQTSVYAGGNFFAELIIPDGYPLFIPRVKMLTQIFHPNFSSRTGYEGCLHTDYLSTEWMISNTITELLEYIYRLFTKPDIEPAYKCNLEATVLYLNDKEKFNETAKEWTVKYAC